MRKAIYTILLLALLSPLFPQNEPFTFKAHGARTPVPEFPKGAKLRTFTTNSDARSGHWQIVFVLDFPAATAVPGARAFDYEMRAVPKDGSRIGRIPKKSSKKS